MQKREKKWGNKYLPQLLLFTFAVGLQCRLYVWVTHRVEYVAPFNPCNEVRWTRGRVMWANLQFGYWHEDAPLQLMVWLYRSFDDCSCGLFVLVYIEMVIWSSRQCTSRKRVQMCPGCWLRSIWWKNKFPREKMENKFPTFFEIWNV